VFATSDFPSENPRTQTRNYSYTLTLAAILIKMSKEEELKSELNSIWKILQLAIQCYEYSSYLYSPKSESESEYIRNSMFFDFTRHIHWRTTVIELAKLVTNNKKNQKFNIFHLLNKLKNDGYFGKLGLDKNEIEKWENLLKNNHETAEEIKTLRNKIYSHTDRNKEKYVKSSKLTFEKISETTNIIGIIIKGIYSDILDTHIDIKPLNSIGENFRIINILAEENEERKLNIINNYIENANKNK
jgi:hypothetical protein